MLFAVVRNFSDQLLKEKIMKKQIGQVVAVVSLSALGMGVASATGTDPIGTVLGAVDLTTVASAVAAIALLLVGIKLTFKGPDVAARVIRKV